MLDYPSSDQLKNCSSTRLGVRYSLGHFVCKETAAVATFTAPIDCTSKLFPPKIDFQKHLIKKVEIFQKSAREGKKICKITAATKCAFTTHRLHQRLDTGYHYLVRADAWPWHLRSIGFQPTVARGANLLGNFFDGISRDSALKGGSVIMCN